MRPLAIAGISIVLAAGASAQPAGGLIAGQVVDAGSGRPVPGAIVAISTLAITSSSPERRPMPATRVMTTAGGHFVFRDLPAARFGLTVTKPGYAEGAYGRHRPGGAAQQLTLGDGERVTDVVIRIWKSGSVSGTVVDEAGEPVIGCVVVALRRSPTTDPRYGPSGGAAVTDDRGMYRFGSLQAAEYIVAVMSRTLSMPASLAATPPSSLDRSMVVPELGVLAMQMTGSSPLMMQVGDVMYAVGGGVAVPPPPAGDRLFVYPTTYYPSTPSVAQAAVVKISSGGDRGDIDFQLQPVAAARVSGSVAGPDGPLATALRLVPADARDAGIPGEGPYTISDLQGVFTFPAVPAGQYSLEARMGPPRGRPGTSGPALWADVPLVVGDRDLSGVTVQLQPGYRISGRAEFEGGLERPSAQRLESVPIAIQPAGPATPMSGPSPFVRLDADGRFSSPGLPPGRYFVRVTGSPTGWRFKSAMHEGRDVADAPLDLRGDAQVVITFSDRWNHLRGTVTTVRGLPDAEAVVLLFPTDSQLWAYAAWDARRFKSARATKSGEYAIGSIPEGDYYAVAVPDANASDWQSPGVLESLSRSATRVTIDEGETRTLHLRTQETR